MNYVRDKQTTNFLFCVVIGIIKSKNDTKYRVWNFVKTNGVS